MPPFQVDVDSSYQDDFNRLFNGDELSPLFRDHDIKIAPSSPSCRLDKRQSDPEYAAAAAEGGRERALLSEDPTLGHRPPSSSSTATTGSIVPCRVSRITAIIGPESAYVKVGDAAPGYVGGLPTPPPPPAADSKSSAPKREVTQARSPEVKTASVGGGKRESKSLFVRATRFVSKRGWKLVKSLPSKLSCEFGTAKVGRHRNVI
jgi:hypothetical protein